MEYRAKIIKTLINYSKLKPALNDYGELLSSFRKISAHVRYVPRIN